MSELEYRRLLQERQTSRLDNFMQQELRNPQPLFDSEDDVKTTTAPPTKSLGLIESIGEAGAAGGKAAFDSAAVGIKHFVNGVYNTVGGHTKRPLTMLEQASGVGEMLLGGISLISALPSGVGEAVHTAIKSYSPGADQAVAIPAGLAGIIRSTLAAPMFLDPAFRESVNSFEAMTKFQEQLYQPMTFGELMGVAATFAAFPLQAKVYSKIKGGVRAATEPKTGTADNPTIIYGRPIIIEDALAVKRATSPIVPDMRALMEQRSLKGTEFALEQRTPPRTRPQAPSTDPMSPEALTARLMLLSTELRAKAAESKGKGGEPSPAESGATKQKTDAKAEEGPKSPESETGPYTEELTTQIDSAMKRAEEIISEEFPIHEPGFADALVEASRKNKAKTEAKGAEKDVNALPPDPTAPVGSAAGEGAYVRPGREAVGFRRSRDAKPSKGAGRVGWDEIIQKKEGGFIDPKLLGRMAVGAAIGGTQGDTPEERMAYIFAGILGGAASKKLAKMLAAEFRAKMPRVMDETNPTVPGFNIPPREIPIVMPKSGSLTVDQVLAFDRGTVVTPEVMRQVNHIEIQAVKQVFDLMRDINDKSPDYIPGQLKKALALARTVSKAAQNVSVAGKGRGGAGRDVMSKVHESSAHIEELSQVWDPSTSEVVLAKLLSEQFKKGEQISLFSRLYYAIPEAIQQAMYGSVLSGAAIAKNAFGAGVMPPLGAVNRSLASLTYWPPTKAGLMEGPRGFVAIWEGLTEQMRLIRHWDALGEQARNLGATHVEVQAHGFQAMADIAAESAHPAIASGLEWIGSAFDLGPGIMSRTDGMAKNVNGRMKATWEAMDIVQREGLEYGTPEYFERLTSMVNDYSQLPVESLVRVREYRDHQTFTQPFEGDIMKGLQSGPADPVLNLMYRMTIGMFVRTPVRLLEVGSEMTPGLNFLAKHYHAEMSRGGKDAATARARLATGAIIIGTFMYAATQGLVTGSPPSDPKDIKALTDAGRPPRSWWDPLAGKYRSYAGFEPLTTLIATGANLARIIPKLNEPDAIRLLLAASLAEVQSIDSNMYLQAISEFVNMFKTGRSDALYESGAEYVRRRLQMFNPAGIREITRQFDPEVSRILPGIEFDKDKTPGAANRRELQMLIDSFERDIPGNALKKDRNMFTGEILINDVWPFNPFTARPRQNAPWALEIARLDGAGLEQLQQWIGKENRADVGLSDQPDQAGTRLTPKELDRWEVLMTQVVTDSKGKLVDSLTALVTSPTYQRQSDITRRDMIQARWGEFKDRALGRLLKEFPELDRARKGNRRASHLERLPLDHPMRKQNLRVQ